MRFVSPLLKNVIYPALQRTGGLKLVAPVRGCAVVNYHGVLPGDYVSGDSFLDANLVSIETLRKQLRFLKAHYEIIRPEEFRDWIVAGKILPVRSVLITCDDGLLNNLTDMLVILQQENVRCLFFVTGCSCSESPGMLWYEELYRLLRTGRLSSADLTPLLPDVKEQAGSRSIQALWWGAVRSMSRLGREDRASLMNSVRTKCKVEQSEMPARRWRLLDENELRQLRDAGMTIGAHTLSHPVLSECSDAESFCEIQESKVQLERVLKQPVWALAYPFGNPSTMSNREVHFAEQAGFDCAFLNADGGFADRTHRFELSRTHITAEMFIPEIEAHMIGLHARLQRAVRG